NQRRLLLRGNRQEANEKILRRVIRLNVHGRPCEGAPIKAILKQRGQRAGETPGERVRRVGQLVKVFSNESAHDRAVVREPEQAVRALRPQLDLVKRLAVVFTAAAGLKSGPY